jgi:hypothetical protein
MHRLTDFDDELVRLVVSESLVIVPLILDIESKASAVYHATVELCNGLVSRVKLYQIDHELIISTGARSLYVPLTHWLQSGAITAIMIEGV